jgi:hypothetical protein
MDVNWKEVYHPYIEGEPRKMKFKILPKVFPWAGDFQENVDLTVEWLVREAKDDEVRLAEESVIENAGNGWYTLEHEPGQFLHCCYPQDLLKFRGQYENVREHIMGNAVENLSTITESADAARTLLWSAWNCLGGDGKRIEPEYKTEFAPGEVIEYQPIIPANEWERQWNYKCFKCCEDLPKALKLWQKMQHGKLKGMS